MNYIQYAWIESTNTKSKSCKNIIQTLKEHSFKCWIATNVSLKRLTPVIILHFR